MSKQRKPLYEFGPFRLDLAERLLLCDGDPVALTPKALETLVVLVERRGRLVEKEELLKTLWPDSFVEEHNLANNISTLRKALGEAKNTPQYIETVPKRGYRFVANVRELSDEVTGVIQKHARSSVIVEEETTTAQAEEGAPVSPLQPLTVPNDAPSTTRRYPRWQAKRYIWTSALMLAIGSAVLLYFSRHTVEPSLPPMKVIPFTTFPGNEYLPSLSPDGNQIAFGWDGEKGRGRENSSIYVKQIGSEKPLRLTSDPANDFGPVWSSDGQRIAFKRITEEVAIFIVPALGGVARKLLTLGPNMEFGGLCTLAWSPDGKFIAFTYRDPKEEPAKIFLVSPDTLERHNLTSPAAGNVGDFNPAFSPDSQSVAFVRIKSAESADIHIVPITGGEPRRLTFDNTQLAGLTWSADGRQIIYSSTRAGGARQDNNDYRTAFTSRLWRIPASGGVTERISVDSLHIFFPNVSRRGNRLTYVQTPPDDWNIYRVEISGTTVSKNPPTRLIASTRQDGAPQFSPDGRRITFHSDRSGPLEIWMCDSDGANLLQVTSLNKRSGSPRWSPNGQQIVFDVYEEGKGDIYTISLEGGPPRPIVTGDSNDHWPSWSADGKWIYFASDRTGKYQVWKAPAEGGDAVQVTRQGGLLPCESLDGKYLYYIKGSDTRGLWRVPVEGGEEVRVLDSFKSELGVVVNDGIYFIDPDAKDGVVVEFFDFATHKERRVAELGIVNILPVCVAVSPDRRQILYTQVDQIGADIILVENFR
jgi:Tol biopolymer transport system component/DNA-binding winged helix-turn-helix (wHTH) protein